MRLDPGLNWNKKEHTTTTIRSVITRRNEIRFGSDDHDREGESGSPPFMSSSSLNNNSDGSSASNGNSKDE